MSEYIDTPGAVDVHTHLREPSTNVAETIAGGTRAALLGGYVFVADMPNNPGAPVWSEDRIDAKIAIAQYSAHIPTGYYAGSQPESDNIGNLAAMAPKAVGLKLYGDPTTGNDNTYQAAEFASIVSEWHRVAPDKPIMFHPGAENLADMIGLVAGDNNHHLHVCHVNSPQQVELVEDAKAQSLAVSCGVCPHHVLKTSHDIHTHGVFAEMKPPLAHQDDAEALMHLLDQGKIDVIETDFAPHSLQAKYQAEHEGGHCFGLPGIENVMPLLFYQVEKGRLDFKRLIDATHTRPAKILGIKTESTTRVRWQKTPAYRIGEEHVEASCGWTPYMGMLAIGKLKDVVIGGAMIVYDGELRMRDATVITNRGELL